MKTIAFILSLLFTVQAISFKITATASLSHPTPVVCAMTVCPSATALVARDLVCPENCKNDCKIIDDVCCPGNQKAICNSSSSNATSTSWAVSALTSTALPTSVVASSAIASSAVPTSAIATSAIATSAAATSAAVDSSASSSAPTQPTQSNTTSGAGKTAIMWSGVCFMMLVIVQVL